MLQQLAQFDRHTRADTRMRLGQHFTDPRWTSRCRRCPGVKVRLRKGGFEPPRSCERQPLKLVRLPVPPLPRQRAERSSIWQRTAAEQLALAGVVLQLDA